jgi:hypothetical protein
VGSGPRRGWCGAGRALSLRAGGDSHERSSGLPQLDWTQPGSAAPAPPLPPALGQEPQRHVDGSPRAPARAGCVSVCECVGQVVPARRQRGLGSPPGGSRAPPPPPPPPTSLPLLVAVWAPERLPRSRRARLVFSEERSSASPCRWEPGLRLPPHAAIPTRPPPWFPPLPPPPPSALPPSLPLSQQPPPLPPQAQRSGDSRPPAAASSSRKFELPQSPLTLRCGAFAVGFREG